MSTLDMNSPRPGRAVFGYLLSSAACVAVTNIYALFGHGVRSASMDYMFLYPALMGLVPFLLLTALLSRIRRRRFLRLAFNLYNSGVATLTVGAMLNGILEIAGTASAYQPLFMAAGWIFAFIGFVLLLIPDSGGRTDRKAKNP